MQPCGWNHSDHPADNVKTIPWLRGTPTEAAVTYVAVNNIINTHAHWCSPKYEENKERFSVTRFYPHTFLTFGQFPDTLRTAVKFPKISRQVVTLWRNNVNQWTKLIVSSRVAYFDFRQELEHLMRWSQFCFHPPQTVATQHQHQHLITRQPHHSWQSIKS